MDVDQTPCLSLLARTQCRERERGQEDVDQSPCLSLLARTQGRERERGQEEGTYEAEDDKKPGNQDRVIQYSNYLRG